MEQEHMSTRDQVRKVYAGLIESFAKEVSGMVIEGIPAPHIPVVGGNYDRCAYKMAFVGMETKGTYKSNCQTFIDNPEGVLTLSEEWLDASGMFKKRERSVYWLFIKHFLQCFYQIKSLKTKKGKYHAHMSSFVWGNANAIERYEVTARKKKVDKKVWQAVKNASKPFDNINHLIDAAQPKVVFITYKDVDKEYLTDANDVCCKKHVFTTSKGRKSAIRYYYLSNRDTHVFVTPHPTWMRRSGIGFKPYINALIKAIEAHHIWLQLPQNTDDWKIKE